MKLKNYRPVLESIFASIAALALHKIFFCFLDPNPEQTFQFSLFTLYGFFAGCSLLITLVSILVRQNNIDSVGQVFLLTTFIQMGACFALFYSRLNVSEADIQIEKANFIAVFLLFLAIETILTIRLLNKNQ